MVSDHFSDDEVQELLGEGRVQFATCGSSLVFAVQWLALTLTEHCDTRQCSSVSRQCTAVLQGVIP
jgi:hypothetical protein